MEEMDRELSGIMRAAKPLKEEPANKHTQVPSKGKYSQSFYGQNQKDTSISQKNYQRPETGKPNKTANYDLEASPVRDNR